MSRLPRLRRIGLNYFVTNPLESKEVKYESIENKPIPKIGCPTECPGIHTTFRMNKNYQNSIFAHIKKL